MSGEAELGKSIPVVKEFRLETVLAPVTPEKPHVIEKAATICPNGQYHNAETEDYLSRFTSQKQGEFSMASDVVGSSSCCYNVGEWAPPPTGISDNGSLQQWGGMSFSDLLALNHGYGNHMSNDYNWDLDYRCPSSGFTYANQESAGRYGGPYNTVEDFYGSNSSYEDIREACQRMENQQIIENAHQNGSRPVFAPETPDPCKRLEDNAAASAKALSLGDIQNGVDSQVSVIGDKGTTELASGSIVVESYDPDVEVNKAIEAKPRRKKHRPKVIREGKPKQTPKQRTPNPNDDANGTPKQKKKKKKYVRKTNLPSTTPLENGSEALGCGQVPDPADKSCRQALEFDLEEDQMNKNNLNDANGTPKQKRKYVRKKTTNLPSTTPLESGSDALGCGQVSAPANKSCRQALEFDLEEDKLNKNNLNDANGAPKQKRKYARKSKTNTPSTTPLDCLETSGAEANGCKVQRAAKSCRKTINFELEDRLLNNNFSPRLTDMPPAPDPAKQKDAVMEATRQDNPYDFCREVQSMSSHSTEATSSKYQLNADMMYPTDFHAFGTNDSAVASSLQGHQFRGLKRDSSCAVHVPNMGMENQAVHCTPSQANYRFLGISCSTTQGMYFPDFQKKRKTEKVLMPKPSSMLSTDGLENIRAASILQSDPTEAAATTSKYYYSVLAPHFNFGAEAGSQTSAVHSHQKHVQFTDWGDIDKLSKRSKALTCVNGLDSQQGSRKPARKRVKGTQKNEVRKAKPGRKRSRKKNSAAKPVTSSFNMVYNHSLNLNDYQHVSGNSKDPLLALPWINTNIANVDEIAEGIEQMNINRECSLVQYQEQNALVQYQAHNQQALVLYQRHGVIVPFKDTRSSKTFLRAKVDIDDETNRVWNLLLEDINSQGIDGTDEDKTKWWEDERNVFRGRVDSFIARMRLVQGDRRFSPWKGSVVDSVVGVFLTQNVSDHLSSSAYMSLAARYPLKPEDEVIRDLEKEIGPPVKEADICIVELDDTSDNYALNEKIVEGHIFDRNFQTSGPSGYTDVSEVVINTDVKDDTLCLSLGNPLYRASSTKELDISSTVDNITIDDVMSSQNSVSSLNSVEYSSVRTPGICVHSNNHSEGEDVTHSSASEELLQLAEKTVLNATGAPIDEKPSCQSDQEDIVTGGQEMVFQSQRQPLIEQHNTRSLLTEGSTSLDVSLELPTLLSGELHATESTCASISTIQNKLAPTLPLSDHNYNTGEVDKVSKKDALVQKTKKQKKPRKASYEWDNLRKQAQANGSRQRTANTMDSLDWEAIRCADVSEISNTIRDRGMNNMLAERIKEFLDRLVNDHGSIDLEWIRDVPPDKAKEYLLSIKGLGLKSVECVRLLTLHHLAFPVDTNVGRIAVRLGWVPLQPLPESLQLHLLELYPILESIQKYLWPRLCKLDQRTLYELHYHMITFGKVFCTKRQPNCNACPLRGECRHFASAFASARLALPGPQDKSMIQFNPSNLKHQDPQVTINGLLMPPPMANLTLEATETRNCEPIVEIPASPEQEPEQIQTLECGIEDDFSEDPNEIPTIKLNMEEFTQTLQSYINSNQELQEVDMSKALVALRAEAASIPTPKLKNVSRLRTEHHVYELPDTHYLLNGLDKREPDDPCPYLLAIWSPGETANSTEPPERRCSFEEPGQLCNDETCFYCNSQREANSQIVRGTLLIPCRTAMRGRFPLNGTYFQVNEVFADQDSSLNPIKVPRTSLWNLLRRTVYFGTSIPTIFKGLSTEEIQHCFWRGYVCVRGFDQKTRAPRPLMARLHFPASRSRARGKFSEKD